MSIKNSLKKQQSNDPVSPEEEEYIRELLQKKQVLEQNMNEKFKSMLENCYQMEETGNDINVNLKGQTEKLENIHSVSDSTKKILKEADETSKEMSSFWYSIGKKIKRIFVKEKEDEFEYEVKNKISEETSSCIEDPKENNFTKCQVPTNDNTNESENTEDFYLDEITNQIRKLVHTSKATNQELTKQHHLINTLDKKTDENSDKINEINKRLVKKFF